MHTSAGLALLTISVSSHGAVTSPRPRNSIDSTLAPWNGTVPDYPIPFTHPNWCEAPDANSKDPRHLSGANGQACFWFSNGCDYGCDKCDGETGQKIPCCNTKFVYTGAGDPPSWSGEGISINTTWLASFNYSQVQSFLFFSFLLFCSVLFFSFSFLCSKSLIQFAKSKTRILVRLFRRLI